MTKQAHIYLHDRLHSIKWEQLPLPKDPPTIRQLRKKLARYDLKVSRVMKERNARRSEAANRVREVIFSGDYEAALKALKAFEKQSF